MVTSVPLSLSSNVTIMVISPAKVGSAESKVIAWTILVGGVSSTNRAVKRSSRSEVLPLYSCSDDDRTATSDILRQLGHRTHGLLRSSDPVQARQPRPRGR